MWTAKAYYAASRCAKRSIHMIWQFRSTFSSVRPFVHPSQSCAASKWPTATSDGLRPTTRRVVLVFRLKCRTLISIRLDHFYPWHKIQVGHKNISPVIVTEIGVHMTNCYWDRIHEHPLFDHIIILCHSSILFPHLIHLTSLRNASVLDGARPPNGLPFSSHFWSRLYEFTGGVKIARRVTLLSRQHFWHSSQG